MLVLFQIAQALLGVPNMTKTQIRKIQKRTREHVRKMQQIRKQKR